MKWSLLKIRKKIKKSRKKLVFTISLIKSSLFSSEFLMLLKERKRQFKQIIYTRIIIFNLIPPQQTDRKWFISKIPLNLFYFQTYKSLQFYGVPSNIINTLIIPGFAYLDALCTFLYLSRTITSGLLWFNPLWWRSVSYGFTLYLENYAK